LPLSDRAFIKRDESNVLPVPPLPLTAIITR
jgi:hypothetical protein